MKGVGNYSGVNDNNGELSPCISRLKNHISFSPRNSSSLGVLSQISEIGNEDIEATSPHDDASHESNGTQHFGLGFPYGSWSDTPQLSENLIGLKRGRSDNEKIFSEVQVYRVCLTALFLLLYLLHSHFLFLIQKITVLRMKSQQIKSICYHIT